jgi:2-haloacid dehalogenase
MDRPKAVLFDVFGTLVDWRTSLIEELSAFGAQRGIAGDWTSLVDAWRGKYAPSMDRVRRGEQGWTKLDDLHRAGLNALCAQFGLDALTEDDRRWIALGWHRLRPWPDTAPGLTRLKRVAIIGPLSNANLSLGVDLAKSAGLPWDVTFGSDIFRRYKPDPEVYLGACALLDLRPDQVMLAAAHNYDLAAARALGRQTGFIPRPTEYGPLQTKDFGPEQAWDVVAESVEGLAAALGG